MQIPRGVRGQKHGLVVRLWLVAMRLESIFLSRNNYVSAILIAVCVAMIVSKASQIKPFNDSSASDSTIHFRQSITLPRALEI